VVLAARAPRCSLPRRDDRLLLRVDRSLPAAARGYANLGPVEGEACATYLLALPWHQLFAIGATDRFMRAREKAIASVPEATGLVEVTSRRAGHGGLFSRRCAIVRGDAIR
jgi:hypothetical protein